MPNTSTPVKLPCGTVLITGANARDVKLVAESFKQQAITSPLTDEPDYWSEIVTGDRWRKWSSTKKAEATECQVTLQFTAGKGNVATPAPAKPAARKPEPKPEPVAAPKKKDRAKPEVVAKLKQGLSPRKPIADESPRERVVAAEPKPVKEAKAAKFTIPKGDVMHEVFQPYRGNCTILRTHTMKGLGEMALVRWHSLPDGNAWAESNVQMMHLAKGPQKPAKSA